MRARHGLTVQVSMVYGRGEVIEPFKTRRRRRQWKIETKDVAACLATTCSPPRRRFVSVKKKKKEKGKGKGKYNKVTFLMTATLEALRSRRLTLIPQSFPRFTPRHAYFFQLFSDEIHLFFSTLSSWVNLLFSFSRTSKKFFDLI